MFEHFHSHSNRLTHYYFLAFKSINEVDCWDTLFLSGSFTVSVFSLYNGGFQCPQVVKYLRGRQCTMYNVLTSVKCILNMSVLCLSLFFFLNHRFCENAELRASFHHVKMLLSSPCPYLSACSSWHVHTCALCTCALSCQLFCLVCV